MMMRVRGSRRKAAEGGGEPPEGPTRQRHRFLFFLPLPAAAAAADVGEGTRARPGLPLAIVSEA